jgi:hypothetical protein
MKALSLLPLLIAGLLPSASSAGSMKTPITVSAVAHGVKLTLTVPRREYPRNALIRAKLSLENISAEAVPVLGARFPACRYQYWAAARVLTKGGKAVYPPIVSPDEFISCGPLMFPLQLRPGETLRNTVFLVLRGSHIQGFTALGTEQEPIEVETPITTVRLTRKSSPHIRLQTSPVLEAVLRGQAHVRQARLYYYEWASCRDGEPRTMDWTPFSIRKARTYSFTPGCENPSEWHLAAGWLNYPIAQVDWKKGPFERERDEAEAYHKRHSLPEGSSVVRQHDAEGDSGSPLGHASHPSKESRAVQG